MKRFLFLVALVFSVISIGAMGFAQESKWFDKRLKIQGYTEYINFTGDDIEGSTWGSGVLVRYLFLDWLGIQTNATLYSASYEANLGGDFDFTNWRVSLILHTRLPDIFEMFYVYGGGGAGVQFNNDIGDIVLDDDAFTGHALFGAGYDINPWMNVEAEAGYQFGDATLEDDTSIDAGIDALFIRVGGGIRF